jgi:sugar lactone lactonase YvrE
MKSTISFSTSGMMALAAVFLMAGTMSSVAENLFVSDTAHGFVYRYQSNGEGQKLVSVYSAEGLAFDSLGDLYVTDFYESIIYKVLPDGTTAIFASGDLVSNASALAFDESDNLFVAHNGVNPGIAKVTPDGTLSVFVADLEPTGLAFDSAGNLYASDYVSNTVLKYAPDGTGVTFASGFTQPVGLAFDSAGNLFVSDLLGDNIYEVAPDGTKTVFTTGLNLPQGLAFDRSGNLFVSNDRNILKFAPDGTRSTFATGILPVNFAFRR